MSKNAQDLVQEARKTVESMTCGEFDSLREKERDFVLLDVRSKEEFDDGHIEGAAHIPRGKLEFKIEETVPDREAMIVLCCGSGARAALAGQSLKTMGYTNLYLLEGGYSGYCEQQKKKEV